MAYTTVEGRQELLDALAEATDAIGFALACVGEAYEQLDDNTADRLEEQLFRPVQSAYGLAKRTHASFAQRHDLPARAFEAQSGGLRSQGAHGFINRAVGAAGEADQALAELQDSMLPVEVGDPEVRAGITEVRTLLGGMRARARELVRVLGR